MPGHKPMKDRLTLLLCANASGDCKIKPLLVYHSDNPRVFKRNNVIKSKLPVMWRANTKAWVTRQFFTEWVHEVFAPKVKEYLTEKRLPMKCLLLMDNAPAHPPALQEDSFIKIQFLPPNTTPILQPMDQQVISNLKKLYTKALFKMCFQVTCDTQLNLKEFWKDHFTILNCVNMVDQAWTNVTYRTLNSAWRKLWPECVTQRNFEGFESAAGPSSAAVSSPVTIEEEAVVEDILSIGKSMGLQLNTEDIEELVVSHSTELTTEELLHLQEQQQQEMAEELSSEEEEVREDVASSVINEICAKWTEVQTFVEKFHPNKAVTNRATSLFNDNVMDHFRRIVQQRKKKLTMDRFLIKEKRKATSEPDSPPKKRDRRETTPEGQLPTLFMEGDSPSKQ